MFLDVDKIDPEEKDYLRALGFGDEIPDEGKASRMAKAITDRAKLVRRSKAVVGIWGTEDYTNNRGDIVNAWRPFKSALLNMGFTEAQISRIEYFAIDEGIL